MVTGRHNLFLAVLYEPDSFLVIISSLYRFVDNVACCFVGIAVQAIICSMLIYLINFYTKVLLVNY